MFRFLAFFFKCYGYIFFVDEILGSFSKKLYFCTLKIKRNPKIFERVGKKIIQ